METAEATITYQDLTEALRQEDLAGDPWGVAMGALFLVAEEIEYARAARVPSEWGYRPSPLGRSDGDDGGYLDYLIARTGTVDLLCFGRLLNRYCDRLRHAGRDY